MYTKNIIKRLKNILYENMFDITTNIIYYILKDY